MSRITVGRAVIGVGLAFPFVAAPRAIRAQATRTTTAAAEQRRLMTLDMQRLTLMAPPSLETALATSAASWAEYRVFYATRRKPSGVAEPEAYYGPLDDSVKFGVATVTIPDHMRPGVEDARGVCRFFPGVLGGCKRGPSNSILIDTIEPAPRTDWLTQVRTAMGPVDSVDALVYVHGYNNTYGDAVRRAAELAYDIGFPGLVFTYDWASRSSLAEYTVDQETAERSAPDFRAFLKAIADSTKARRIAIVAHSMGTRLVAYALRDLGDTLSRLRLGPIVFAASDVDSAIFRDQLAPAMARAGRPVTLYASTRDKALRASADFVHGAPRVGSGPPSLMLFPGIDYVDASLVDTDMLGHGYFAENKGLLDDIFLIIRHGFGAADRNLAGVSAGALRYYRLR
jgi:esterase/lipase superfamily enzyme